MIEFLRNHEACEDGIEWAINNCSTLMDCWNSAKPEWLIWLATRDGVLTDRELHEFGLWSAEQVRHLMTDPRSTAALDAKRGWLDGEVSDDELSAAWAAARAAVSAAESAAWAAVDAETWAADAAAESAKWSLEAASWAAKSAKWAAEAAAKTAAWAASKSASWAAESAAWAVKSAVGELEAAARAAGTESLVAARESQAAWLRENTKPNFGEDTK